MPHLCKAREIIFGSGVSVSSEELDLASYVSGSVSGKGRGHLWY